MKLAYRVCLKNVTFAVFAAKNAETKVTFGIYWGQKV